MSYIEKVQLTNVEFMPYESLIFAVPSFKHVAGTKQTFGDSQVQMSC